MSHLTRLRVSIPFIAGQWSLRTSPDPDWIGRGGRFNPLHCGAVVASREAGKVRVSIRSFQSPSLRGSGRFAPWEESMNVNDESFNPLHCGAVVASTNPPPKGQPRLSMFQSPSLRGSGRFGGPKGLTSPEAEVSIPFIAGQWSLRACATSCKTTPTCFNPLHCGAVVASRRRAPRSGGRSKSFNPLHCGAVVASGAPRRQRRSAAASFNPLHCGAVVASAKRVATPRGGARSVSIPFIAGQWSLPGV